MNTKPEALRLAEQLESDCDPLLHLVKPAAAELRRLHEVNQGWEIKAANWLASPDAAQKLEGYRELTQRVNQLESLNAELLEALEIILDSRPFVGMNPKATVGSPYAVEWNVHTIAREAIAKATGEQA